MENYKEVNQKSKVSVIYIYIYIYIVFQASDHQNSTWSCPYYPNTLVVVAFVKGWQWGEAGLKDEVFAPALHGFVLFHSRPTPHNRKNFPAPSPPLGPRKSSSYPVKLYFLLICLQLLQLFLIKLDSLIKIYLKLQISLSHQIKQIFSKN